MEHKESSVVKFEKFTWKIENFPGVSVMPKWIPSDVFVLGGYRWRISVFPKGMKRDAYDSVSISPKRYKRDDSVSIYLDVVQINEISERWSRDVKFNLLVLNQLNANRTISKASDIQFNPSRKSWGFPSFMSSAELHDPNNGFIVNDTCIVGVEVCVCKSSNEKPLNQTEHMEVEVPCPNPNPIVEGYEKNSTNNADAELAYASLGKVLCFLMTRKVKDMNEQAWKELQVLWNELEKFKLNLTWLEPHVRSALGMKSFVEKAIKVQKLKENVVVQELEIERLQKELVAAEVNLNTERNLLKTKGLKELDLDSELGRGSWRS